MNLQGSQTPKSVYDPTCGLKNHMNLQGSQTMISIITTLISLRTI